MNEIIAISCCVCFISSFCFSYFICIICFLSFSTACVSVCVFICVLCFSIHVSSFFFLAVYTFAADASTIISLSKTVCSFFFFLDFCTDCMDVYTTCFFVTLDIDGILTERDLKSNKMELVLLIIFFAKVDYMFCLLFSVTALMSLGFI